MWNVGVLGDNLVKQVFKSRSEINGEFGHCLYKQLKKLEKTTRKKYKVNPKEIGVSKAQMDEYGRKLGEEE